MNRHNAALDTTYDQFADDSYDLSRIKDASGVLIDLVLKAFISTDIEEAAYRLRELIDENSRRHVREMDAACGCPDGHDDLDF